MSPLEKRDMMDHTDPLRAVNGDFAALIPFVLANGGGWIPPAGSGHFNAKLLGMLMGRTPRWVQAQVTEHQIPFLSSGDGGEMFIDSGRFADGMQKFNEPEE